MVFVSLKNAKLLLKFFTTEERDLTLCLPVMTMILQGRYKFPDLKRAEGRGKIMS